LKALSCFLILFSIHAYAQNAPKFRLQIPKTPNEHPPAISMQVGGKEALKVLGKKGLEKVAKLNHMTAAKLKNVLLNDHTVFITNTGELVFIEDVQPGLKESK
jgi:hypothetical protein